MKGGIGDDGLGGAMPSRQLGEARHIAPRRQSEDLESFACAADQIQCGPADGTGRAKYRDLSLVHPVQSPVISTAIIATTTASNPSRRSSTPPCPGRIVPLSLTPARLFSQLS